VSCTTPEIVDGAKVLDPKIIGGEADGLTLDTPVINGLVTADDAAWQSLADGVAPLLPEVPLNTSAVAAVLKDCGGANLVPSQRVASCENLNEAVTETKRYTDQKTDPFAISATFKNAEGQPLSPGTSLMSSAQVDAAIKQAICDIIGNIQNESGQKVIGFNFNPTLTTLTLTVTDGVNTTPWPVDFSAFVKNEQIGLGTPTAQNTDYLPLTIYGGLNVLLGQPYAFISKIVNGTKVLIPTYIDPTP
jgi:hypothetical protein